MVLEPLLSLVVGLAKTLKAPYPEIDDLRDFFRSVDSLLEAVQGHQALTAVTQKSGTKLKVFLEIRDGLPDDVNKLRLSIGKKVFTFIPSSMR